MKFTLTIDCDNAAFDDDAQYEIERILRVVANNLSKEHGLTQTLFDINGNKVGKCGMTVGEL